MKKTTQRTSIKILLFILTLIYCTISAFSQTIYTNDMDYVIGDCKQAFITNAIKTEEHADNLLKGFIEMQVNGIRIPIFGRDVNGDDLNPNKPIFDYFYSQVIAQGLPIFANPAQGGGGARVANNMLNGTVPSVNGVQAATDELIARVLEFSAEYPECKWLNPFNEDGRATSSTWTIDQIHAIYAALYNNVNGAELIGPCTWGLPAGIDMLQNTDIADYITVAATHNLGFHHGQWPTFIALADAESLPVWDSEVNHNDAKGNGTRLEKAIENEVDGLVLYNVWNTISLTDGSITRAAQDMMLLYLKDYTIPVFVNHAVTGTASQSALGYNGATADKANDGNTSGHWADGSISIPGPVTSTDYAWWEVDLGSEKTIGDIKVYNRTNCCTDNLTNFTVIVLDNNRDEVYSKEYTAKPQPSVTAETGGVTGRFVRIQSNIVGTNMNIAEVEVKALPQLSTEDNENIKVAMYPNPVVDKLSIVSPNAEFNQYTIYNINGQELLSDTIDNVREIEINVSEFSKGIYLLKLKGVEHSKTYKIVKD
ncbi:T9SS type A sorting domain-containing protein [Flavivirga aquimarina]|uniref:T9SS type A sorting domain-containing protein n=1 Tax=Flavivirga aquimarina TaxID=2027862 RepID=A0ABT8W6G6_9FLAO|nr:T9SS type A sorting domain-containing protein [Flavivirga aquimarina]MDO5968708.1 T9SS type A sorting domain-containing protein [Flavivirga aquimarina]